MDTLTMVKEAIENPEQQYETYHGKVHYDEGTLKWVDDAKPFVLGEATLEFKWRKVPEPVEFMTAIMRGERITLKTNVNTGEPMKGNLREICRRTPKEMLKAIAEYDNEVIREIFLNGEWYIED